MDRGSGVTRWEGKQRYLKIDARSSMCGMVSGQSAGERLLQGRGKTLRISHDWNEGSS